MVGNLHCAFGIAVKTVIRPTDLCMSTRRQWTLALHVQRHSSIVADFSVWSTSHISNNTTSIPIIMKHRRMKDWSTGRLVKQPGVWMDLTKGVDTNTIRVSVTTYQ